MFGISIPLSALSEATMVSGYALALSLVVLLQYIHSITIRTKTVKSTQRFERDVEGLSLEVLQLSRERGLQRLENQILREVLTQSDCQKAIGHLLRRYIINPEDSFGIFMPLDPASDMPYQSRGLSDESIKNLSLDHGIIQKLQEHPAVIYETPTITSCPMYGMLALQDRRKSRHIFVIGVGDERGLLGVLIASSLLPVAGTRPEQIELTTRLLSSIAPNLRQTLELERQSIQLRCTREMLELRSITDGKVGQPTALVEKFLTRLGQMVEVERTVLFLAPTEPSAPPVCSIRCGLQLQNGIQQRWNDYEQQLAQQGFLAEQLVIWDTSQLCRFGIDTLIGSAVLIPLSDGGRRLGVVCLTRRIPQGFSVTQRQLLSWAGESLSHTLERVMSFVAIERQAKQDGLTGLANRRTFDDELASALLEVRSGRLVECSLLLLDLDRFKSVNDVYGHLVGDAVLRESAQKIREQIDKVRSNDRALAARYGGEEMALLLPGVGISGAFRIAESVRLAIERHVVRSQGTALQVTVSIGVASCPLHAQTSEKLVQAADLALYAAKSNGRNRVEMAPDPFE